MTELSRRGYAKTRGVSEAAVRGYITSGVLADAVLPSGLLDAETADKLLAANLVKPKPGKVPVALQTARLRRMRAQARDLLDEVGEWKRTMINPKDVDPLVADAKERTESLARPWVIRTVPSVVGKDGYEAQRLLKLAVNELLGELHEMYGQFADSRPPREAEPEPDWEP